MSQIQDETNSAQALLATLSDDLALPLVQIKTTLELLNDSPLAESDRQLVKQLGLSAESGLKLVEAYRLALSLGDTTQLPLEPVAIGAILSDVAHELSPLAKTYNTELWVDVQPHLAPVLANHTSLLTALICLGSSLIRAQSADQEARSQVLLAAHRHIDGSTTGVYSSAKGISAQALRAARSLSGKARQPLPSVPAGTASGVLVADMLCTKIWQPLTATRHQNLDGLTTLVPVSHQLSLV